MRDMMQHYILGPANEILPVDPMTWATWFEWADRSLWRTRRGNTLVSTVFLGIDHNFLEEGPPILFETMIFGGPLDQEYQTRCATYAEAEIMHQDALAVAFPGWRVRFVQWLGWAGKMWRRHHDFYRSRASFDYLVRDLLGGLTDERPRISPASRKTAMRSFQKLAAKLKDMQK